MDIGTLVMKINADVSDAESKLGGFKKSLGALGGIVAGAGAAVVGGLGFAIADGIKGISDMEDQVAQLESVLKSTGGAAGVSADQVTALAESMQKTTKFAAENIMEGQNLLLTFTKIGSDVFPRATKAMADMAQGMGTDVSSQAIALGKALNDPIKGVASLGRVGVQFSDEQKKMIETMVATNDIAGAQGIILNELETQFGGSAEAAGKTFSGQMEIAKNALGEIFETIAMSVMPILQSMLEWVNAHLPEIQAVFQTVFDVVATSLKVVWDIINATLMPVLEVLFSWFKDNMPTIQTSSETVFGAVKDVMTTLYNFVKDNFTPIFEAWVKYIKDNWPTIQKTFEEVFKAIGIVVNELWTFFKDNLLPIIKAVFNFAKENMPLFQKIFETVFGVVASVVKVAWEAVKLLWGAFKGVWEFVEPTFPLIGKVIKTAMDVVTGVIEGVTNTVKTLVEWIKNAVEWFGKLANARVDDENRSIYSQSPTAGLSEAIRGTPTPSSSTNQSAFGNSSTRNSVNNVNINVSGAGNPNEVGRSIVRELQMQGVK